MFTIPIQSLAVCENLSYLNDGDSWLGRVTMLGKWMHYITLPTVSIRWNSTSVFYILLRFYKSTFFERHVHCTDNCNSIHDSMISYNITSNNNFYNGIDKNRNHNAYVNIYNMKTVKMSSRHTCSAINGLGAVRPILIIANCFTMITHSIHSRVFSAQKIVLVQMFFHTLELPQRAYGTLTNKNTYTHAVITNVYIYNLR